MGAMVTPSDRPGRSQAGSLHAARRQRDAAFQRVRAVTRTVTVASVAAVAGLTVYFSQARPGHTTSTNAPGGVTPTGSTPTVGGSAGDGTPAVSGAAASPSSTGSSSSGYGSGTSEGGSAGLSAPASAPQPSQQPAPVISGSS